MRGLAPGKRLSEIRQQQGLSQRRAAELSGLTHSAISTIEQDKVSPAISTLQKLLKVYGLSLSEFFSEPEKPDEPQVVINQDDLIEMGSQGVSMKLVHNGNPNRTLAMIFETYQPGTTTGERIKHQGEEIGTVLEGEIVLTINGRIIISSRGKVMPLIPAFRTVSVIRRQAFAELSAPIRPPRFNLFAFVGRVSETPPG